jgi:diguanylate cyclase (GGDEF)-like protein/putative nucleotidyltransferase with HDIG domain
MLVDVDVWVGLFALALLVATLGAYRHERTRTTDALRVATALERVARELASEMDPLAVLRSIPQLALTLVAAEASTISVRQEERSKVTAAAGLGDRLLGVVRGAGEGVTGEVMRTGATVVIDDYRAWPQAVPQASALGVRTTIGTPVFVHGELEACLVVSRTALRRFSALDRQAIEGLAAHASIALANARQLTRLRDLYLATVRALAAAVDARDPYTRSHSARVSALAKMIAEEMKLPSDEVRRVQLGALLHDLGKIGIPDAILNKPSALSPDEWVIMRTHPSVGASIVGSVEPLADLVPIVRDHHERYDGAGYPAGLAGDAIDLTARIVAAADAYEVMVSKRAYKEAQTVDAAVAELRRCRGSQFHPDVVDAFVRVIERDLAHGAHLLARVGALQHEEIEDVPGPGEAVQRYVAVSATHGRRLAVLQRLASEFGAVLDLDELAGRLLRIVCDAMGYENGFLLTTDTETADMLVRAAFGPSEPYVGSRVPRGTGISSWVVEHGRLQNVGDVTSDRRFFGPPDVRSSLLVPLRIDEDVVGVLGIESPRMNAFTAEDEQLLTAVSHQIAAAIRVASLHRIAKQAAATDVLTGLANRRTFFERLGQELAAGVGPDRPLTVALVDVDLLKEVNDVHGHQAGDESLVTVGEVLVESVRSEDLVARIGGDEFAILFTAPIFVADRAMRRARERLAGRRLSNGAPVPSVSWGLANAIAPATPDELVEIADRALYRHKDRARDGAVTRDAAAKR